MEEAPKIDSSGRFGRRADMTSDAMEFASRVEVVLRKFFRQNGYPEPDAETCRDFTRRLWDLVIERGLPRPLSVEEQGEPGGMSESELEPLINRVVGDGADAGLSDAAKQLVKACFYPEFRTCRDSFREISADGHCRRQELPRALRRVSGVHCVDCPYWVSLTPAQHEKFLSKSWCADPAEFVAHRGVFLPEEFRALRGWLHAAARRNRGDS